MVHPLVIAPVPTGYLALSAPPAAVSRAWCATLHAEASRQPLGLYAAVIFKRSGYCLLSHHVLATSD